MEFSIPVICPRNLANMSPRENEGIHEGRDGSHTFTVALAGNPESVF